MRRAIMWDAEKVILVTNNRKAEEKYRDIFEIRFEDNYEAVLLKTRDMVYSGYSLLTHPQASSLKPNQTPVRSVLLYPYRAGDDHGRDCLLIEDVLHIYWQWQEIAPTPESYKEAVRNDFETIDLSMIDGAAGKLGI